MIGLPSLEDFAGNALGRPDPELPYVVVGEAVRGLRGDQFSAILVEKHEHALLSLQDSGDLGDKALQSLFEFGYRRRLARLTRALNALLELLVRLLESRDISSLFFQILPKMLDLRCQVLVLNHYARTTFQSGLADT